MPLALSRAAARALAAAALFSAAGSFAAPTAYQAVGADAASITPTVDAFRADLGTLNANGPCTGSCVPGVGRREVNWDAVPDALASPNAFPGNFFNLAAGNPAGRVRGIQFATPGTFEVSSRAASGVPVLFGNHTAENADDFAAFSAERIFGLVGSNVLDVTFAVPGSPDTAATVRGFGVVFTDVEAAGSTGLDFYDINDTLLLHVDALPHVVPGAADTFDSFSFAGATFDGAVVRRVRITNGTLDLNLASFGSGPADSVAMDDFIFGQPLAIPLPGSLALSFAALALLAPRRRFTRPTA